MREYELTVVYDLAVAEAGGPDASVELLTHAVESRGGTVLRVDHWGRRRMAYPISRVIDADYVVSRVELEPSAECIPGMVMIIGADGAVTPCARAYDKRVVGVISGAGTLRAAVTLGADDVDVRSAPIALVGTTYCWVDATDAAVEVGDLLTCSDTPGHAMKVTDHSRSPGSVIGKALAGWDNGRGLIPIVVALQ